MNEILCADVRGSPEYTDWKRQSEEQKKVYITLPFVHYKRRIKIYI